MDAFRMRNLCSKEFHAFKHVWCKFHHTLTVTNRKKTRIKKAYLHHYTEENIFQYSEQKTGCNMFITVEM